MLLASQRRLRLAFSTFMCKETPSRTVIEVSLGHDKANSPCTMYSKSNERKFASQCNTLPSQVTVSRRPQLKVWSYPQLLQSREHAEKPQILRIVYPKIQP